MRYYDITVGDKHYTSHPNGVMSPPDPGALQVEMDLFALPNAIAATDSMLRIWGIPLSDIAQSQDLNFKNIAVKGGMGKGLPLANPRQSGLLIQGSVKQAFGNWVGTNMSLDLIITAPITSSDAVNVIPRNLVLNWRKGQPASEAIQQTLQTAFPQNKVDIQIDSSLILKHDEYGVYSTLAQFSAIIKSLTRDIKGGTYPGVDILLLGSTFKVRDGSVTSSSDNTKEISFTDLIGQVTWIAPLTVQATCVMRADIQVMDYIKLPPGQITVTQAALTSLSGIRQSSIFQGTFQVQKVRHVGNYKQPDAHAWITVLDMAMIPGTADVPAPSTAPVPTGGFASGPPGFW